MGKNWKTLQGNCVDRLQEIPDGVVDFVFSDPPYGITKNVEKWSGQSAEQADWNNRPVDWALWWPEIRRVCKDGAAVVLMGFQPFSSQRVIGNLKEFKYEWIWRKTRATNALNARKSPMSVHCNLLVFVVGGGKPRFYDPKGRPDGSALTKTTVLDFQSVEKPVVFSEKPVALCRFMIETYTGGGLVLDPFMGSGSTGVAALQLGRRFVGIEAQPKVYEIAKLRLAHAMDDVQPTKQELLAEVEE